MLWSHTCNFFGNENFFISKKNTSVGSCAFQKKLQWLDQPTLATFFTFFEKKITTGQITTKTETASSASTIQKTNSVLSAHYYQFGCGILKMVGPKKIFLAKS